MPKIEGLVLAIDLRSDRISYAVLDGSSRLLDIGASQFESATMARMRAAALLRTFRPGVLLLRRLRPRSRRNGPKWNTAARAIREEAKHASVPVAAMTEDAIKRHYRRLGCRNKFQIAELLARRFPRIAWKLPPPRKSYEPEPWAIGYFDAISIGIAFLERIHDSEAKVESSS